VFPEVLDQELITRLQIVIDRAIGKNERQDAEVDEVLPMDASKALSDDQAQAKKLRSQRGMFRADRFFTLSSLSNRFG